jgi:hypothetical protein
LDIVVETDSLLRVAIHSKSAKNQVSAYLLEHVKESEALAWTTGSGSSSSFVYLAKAQKRAYSLKIEYDALDQDDSCPTFDLRIILKPVDEALKANLKCPGAPLPPASVDITGDDFEKSASYSMGYDFIQKVTDQGGPLEYDIALRWPGADKDAQYYLDVESKSDVLTGQMTYTLLYERKDKSLGLLGKSHPVGSSAHNSQFTQRLKLLDREGDLAEDVDLDGAILRLRFPPSSVHLLDTLKDLNYFSQGREICHNFALSIRAELRSGENESGLDPTGPSRLVRVRWEGDEVGDGLFDFSSRIYASLEFDRSMKAAVQLLKNSDFVSLEAASPRGSSSLGSLGDTAPEAVKPTFKRLSAVDPSTILLEFSGGSLARGWCHKLHFADTGPFGGPDFDVEHLSGGLKVCASSCLCNWKGTESCSEDEGLGGGCQCREPYTGPDCGQCKAGHTLNPGTGECTLASACAGSGGADPCNGHGQCEQVGAQAVCHCEPGFADDGLERCSRCADPLFEYPDCQLRNWVLSEPSIDCKDLDYKMPRKLWRDGPGSSNSEPLQGEDGEVNWAQRYRLNDGKTLRKASSHYFTVPEASVFRFHLDTSQSGAKVKYRLFDDESRELLTSAGQDDGADPDGFVESANDFLLLH